MWSKLIMSITTKFQPYFFFDWKGHFRSSPLHKTSSLLCLIDVSVMQKSYTGLPLWHCLKLNHVSHFKHSLQWFVDFKINAQIIRFHWMELMGDMVRPALCKTFAVWVLPTWHNIHGFVIKFRSWWWKNIQFMYHKTLQNLQLYVLNNHMYNVCIYIHASSTFIHWNARCRDGVHVSIFLQEYNSKNLLHL